MLCRSLTSMDSGIFQDDSAHDATSGASAIPAHETSGQLHSSKKNGLFNVLGAKRPRMEQSLYLEKQRKEEFLPSNGKKTIPKVFDTTAMVDVEKTSLSRPTLVHGVSQWDFPLGTRNKSEFVFESLRGGFDAKVVTSDITSFTHPKTQPRHCRNTRKRQLQFSEKASEDKIIRSNEKDESVPFGSPGSRRRINEGPTFEKKIRPKATGIEFDTRFLSFALAPDGGIMEEKLVWSIDKSNDDVSYYDRREACMGKIPDLPKRCRESLSRVGPMYQARLPTRLKPCRTFSCCWDHPKG
jgi:hypothetical protein